MRRYAKRRDENEGEIVRALEAIGVWVFLAEPPQPDLLLYAPWFGYQLAEVKNPNRRRGGKDYGPGGLTPRQVDFHKTCPGPIPIWKTPEEAVAWVEAQR